MDNTLKTLMNNTTKTFKYNSNYICWYSPSTQFTARVARARVITRCMFKSNISIDASTRERAFDLFVIGNLSLSERRGGNNKQKNKRTYVNCGRGLLAIYSRTVLQAQYSKFTFHLAI